MASITMTASILGCSAVTNRSTVATPRRLVVKAVRSVEGEKMVRYENEKEGSKNGRRNLMFAAAAVCSVGGVAMADDEPKRGTPEAKKKYAPVCVTMPTARICRN
jgi:hypothetical protein